MRNLVFGFYDFLTALFGFKTDDLLLNPSQVPTYVKYHSVNFGNDP